MWFLPSKNTCSNAWPYPPVGVVGQPATQASMFRVRLFSGPHSKPQYELSMIIASEVAGRGVSEPGAKSAWWFMK